MTTYRITRGKVEPVYTSPFSRAYQPPDYPWWVRVWRKITGRD